MMRCTDSAIFSQDPLIGVYSGMIPCANNQVTMSVLKCPARLSQISNNLCKTGENEQSFRRESYTQNG